MTRLVLDASAGVELLLNTSRAHSLSAQFPSSAEWWVPEHYFVEVAGALRRAVLNGDATLERVEHAFSMLERALLRRAQVRPLLSDAWARRAAITIADSGAGRAGFVQLATSEATHEAHHPSDREAPSTARRRSATACRWRSISPSPLLAHVGRRAPALRSQTVTTVTRSSSPAKSSGFRVHNGSSAAAATAAISKSTARAPLALRPRATTAAQIRP